MLCDQCIVTISIFVVECALVSQMKTRLLFSVGWHLQFEINSRHTELTWVLFQLIYFTKMAGF